MWSLRCIHDIDRSTAEFYSVRVRVFHINLTTVHSWCKEDKRKYLGFRDFIPAPIENLESEILNAGAVYKIISISHDTETGL